MDHIIILAAGKGTRMKTDLPKVLNKINGQSFINNVISATKSSCNTPSIVVGFQGEQVIKETQNKYHYIWQKKQLGTGHALMCAKKELSQRDIKTLFVLNGDHPLISEKTVKEIIHFHNKSGSVMTVASVIIPNFSGDFSMFYDFGRIVRGSGKKIERIVELKDANEDHKKIKEVNISYYCFNARWLWQNVGKINNKNSSREYYLTDLIGIAFRQGEKINSYIIKNPVEGIGVNTVAQLEIAKKYHRKAFYAGIIMPIRSFFQLTKK